MAINFDSASEPTPGNRTWSHTVGGGSNRILFVTITHHDSDTLTGIDYGGVALTQLLKNTGGGNGRYVYIFYLKNPTSGTDTITITGTFASGSAHGAVSFSGVHQTDTFRGTQDANGSGTTASVTISSATNDMVLDIVGQWAGSFTVGAGQTERWNFTDSAMTGGTSTEDGVASVTMSWTVSNADWTISAVSIKPAEDYEGAVDDTVTMTDVVIGGFEYTDSTSETATITDVISSIKEKYAISLETVTITDSTLAYLETCPETEEDVTVTDVASSIGIYNPNISNTATISDSISADILKPARRNRIKISATGKHLSFMFRNNSVDQSLCINDVIFLITKYNRPSGSKINATGNHISLKFQNNTIDETFYLEDMQLSLRRLVNR